MTEYVLSHKKSKEMLYGRRESFGVDESVLVLAVLAEKTRKTAVAAAQGRTSKFHHGPMGLKPKNQANCVFKESIVLGS